MHGLHCVRRRQQPPPPIAPAKRTDGDGLTVFYASQKGHSKNFAERLVAEAPRASEAELRAAGLAFATAR